MLTELRRAWSGIRLPFCCPGRRLPLVSSDRRLTATEQASLKRDGYLLVPSLLDEGALVRIRHRLDELVRQTIDAWQAFNSSLWPRLAVTAGFAPGRC
jgi:hypothetical protein